MDRTAITYKDLEQVIDSYKNNEILREKYIYCIYNKKQYRIRFEPHNNSQWYIKTIFGYFKCISPIN